MTDKNNLNLEIYEFILNEYSASPGDTPADKFYSTKLTSVPPENCGYIGKEETPYVKKPVNDTKPRSCDSLDGTIKNMSTTAGDKPALIIEDDNHEMDFTLNLITSNDLIKFTHLFNTKEKTKNSSTNSIVEANIPNMTSLYNVDNVNSLLTNIKAMLTADRANDNTTTHDYIKILRPSISDKLIIIGDLHGSYASFVRILLRLRKLKVFNENCLFKEDYHLIFLGDLVDRGNYGLEILTLIFMLKLLNPNNVHINNGNHEEERINGFYGFKMELLAIFGSIEGTKIWNGFNDIFKLNHSAVMVENPNLKKEYTYLSHGGYPIEDATKTFPSEFSQDAINDPSNKIFIPVDKIKNNIRWVDFYGRENTVPNQIRRTS